MKISTEVLAVLSALEVGESEVRITQPLDRKLYTKVNDVLVALGGKWNRGRKSHVFQADTDVSAVLDQCITSGEVTTHKDMGFFETPESIAADLVRWAGVTANSVVLEPSAGLGRLVRPCLEQKAKVIAVEVDAVRALNLERSMFNYVVVEDFMQFQAKEPITHVVMNPPFTKQGLGDHLDHVRHAFDMLSSGGVLVAILPSSIEFRQDKRHTEFRNWVNSHGCIEKLPDGSFKESGTSVSTVRIRMEKP